MTYPLITGADTRKLLARQFYHYRKSRALCLRESKIHKAFSAEQSHEIACAALEAGRIDGMRLALRLVGE